MEINQWEKQLRLILKNRLSTRENKKYIQWRLERKRSFNDLDHIAKKRNDLLLAERNHNEHINDEYKNYTDNFINSLEELFTYVEYLQEKLDPKKKIFVEYKGVYNEETRRWEIHREELKWDT